MRVVALALVTVVLLGPSPAAAEAPAEELRRPATPQRRIAQALGAASLVLVAGGGASFGAALGLYGRYRDGCGAVMGCTTGDVAPGKVAQAVGWSLAGAGVAAGLSALLFAWLDHRATARRVVVVPSTGGISVAGAF